MGPNDTNKRQQPKGVIQHGAPGGLGLVLYLKTVVTLAESQSATWLNPGHARQKTFLNLCQLTAHPPKNVNCSAPKPRCSVSQGLT